MGERRKFAFIDRDGTIIKEPPDFQLDRLDKVEFVEDVFYSLKALAEHGYDLVMVTNQDGLGTASFPQNDFDLVHTFIMKALVSQGIHFKAVQICPHRPDDGCDCRKPRLGLVLPYINEMDREHSFVVGDRASDVELAQGLGIRGFQLGISASWREILNEVLYPVRRAVYRRTTQETAIEVETRLDGKGEAQIQTGLGFFNHMLEQLARHSGISLWIQCQGDLEVDEHHTVEDVALALGQCLSQALAERRGIQRYAFLLPMDEAAVQIAFDLSGRPFFKFAGEFRREYVGDLPTEMVPHFFKSLSDSLKATLHLRVEGENTHHMVEACFKGMARVLGEAIRQDHTRVPSTKGVL